MTLAVAATGGIVVSPVISPGAAWDRYVTTSPNASFCHLSSWHAVMTRVLGHECEYLGAFDTAGELCGALPLVRVKSRLFGNFLISMPFLNYGGPLGTPDVRASLVEAAIETAKRSGSDLLELRTREDPPQALANAAHKVTVLLPLPETAEELWQHGFRAKLRSQIKRAQRENMTTRFGTDQVDAFYRVFARNMRDLGTPVLPRSFFVSVAAHFGERVLFGVVYRDTLPVAAGCGFFFGDEFEITWASSLREYSKESPNMLLYWEFLQKTIAAGTRVFNFGRCTPGGGTYNFKLQWGGSVHPLPWASWTSASERERPTPEGGRFFRMAVATWQRLPLGVANRLGPMVARVLP